MANYNLLNTSYIMDFISKENEIKREYQEMRDRYNAIVKELTENWKGRGADAFADDSKKVVANIAGIEDVLSTVCDTLNDCLEIIRESDSSLGAGNRDAAKD